MTGRLTLDLQEDGVAGQAHPEAPVWSGGQHQPVCPTRATDHAATPLAVVSPDQQPGQGHHHMSLTWHSPKLHVTTHAGGHSLVGQHHRGKLSAGRLAWPLQQPGCALNEELTVMSANGLWTEVQAQCVFCRRHRLHLSTQAFAVWYTGGGGSEPSLAQEYSLLKVAFFFDPCVR